MIKVIQHQNLLDIAIQESGSVLYAVEWAIKNNISLTTDLPTGAILNEPNIIDYSYNDVVKYFNSKGLKIATNINQPISQEVRDLQYLFPLELPISL